MSALSPSAFPATITAPSVNPSNRSTSAARTSHMLTLGTLPPPYPRPGEHEKTAPREPLEYRGQAQQHAGDRSRLHRAPRLPNRPRQQAGIQRDIGQQRQRITPAPPLARRP